MTKAYVLGPGEGASLMGGRNTIKASAEKTGGTLAAIETVIPPGRWIPAHTHAGEEEAWYILEGTLTFLIDTATYDAPAGSFVLVPRGSVHSFGNDTDAVARFLELFAPAGMEGYFRERAALAAADAEGELDYAGLNPDAHAALAGKYNMKFV
ncbi:MAG: cupin domain-containing protein [Dehalococcoidia bacterium]|nr:MAG: cupin domain-containing protein [Dehalococcoidia bacterium]